MDLSTINIPDTIDVHLEFPDPKVGLLYADDEEKTKPMVISLYSPAADAVISYKHERQKRLLSKMGKRGLKVFEDLDPTEQEAEDIDRLVAFTAAVKNVIFNGEELTKDTIRDIYADPKMSWITDQLNAKLGSWEDFLS